MQEYARSEIKAGLAQLPESHGFLFKRMYANGDLDMDINTVVDIMPEEKLDWAMTQVNNSLIKLGK